MCGGSRTSASCATSLHSTGCKASCSLPSTASLILQVIDRATPTWPTHRVRSCRVQAAAPHAYPMPVPPFITRSGYRRRASTRRRSASITTRHEAPKSLLSLSTCILWGRCRGERPTSASSENTGGRARALCVSVKVIYPRFDTFKMICFVNILKLSIKKQQQQRQAKEKLCREDAKHRNRRNSGFVFPLMSVSRK